MTEDDNEKFVNIIAEQLKEQCLEPIPANPATCTGIFHRLTTGNMSLSQKEKSVQFFKTGIAHGTTY